MRRLILTTMAAALVAATPVAAAFAQGHGQGRGGYEQRGGRGDWRGGGGPRFERREGRGERRFEGPRQFRPERQYEAPRRLRPGGYLPGAYREGRVENYGRYRLRPPPQGYNWYRVGDGFLLVAPDGQILDMIVD